MNSRNQGLSRSSSTRGAKKREPEIEVASRKKLVMTSPSSAVQTLRRRGRRLLKRLQFTLESRSYLDPAEYATNTFSCGASRCQITWKIGNFSLFCGGKANLCTKNYSARAQLLFFSLNVLFDAVLVVVAVFRKVTTSLVVNRTGELKNVIFSCREIARR